MAKPEWGTKRTCLQCGTRYYDMKKKQPVCPGCGAVFDLEGLSKTRRGKAPVEEKPRKPLPSQDMIDDLPIVEGDETEDSVIEDADELADDMDVEEVVEVEEGDTNDDR